MMMDWKEQLFQKLLALESLLYNFRSQSKSNGSQNKPHASSSGKSSGNRCLIDKDQEEVQEQEFEFVGNNSKREDDLNEDDE